MLFASQRGLLAVPPRLKTAAAIRPGPTHTKIDGLSYTPTAAMASGIGSIAQLRRQLSRLCKLRVVGLIVFTAVIGMFLAVPGIPVTRIVLLAGVGIGLVAAGAAALNCLVEREIDAKMARTRTRPLPAGLIMPHQTLALALTLGISGLVLLYVEINPLTMWLTLATFLGYTVIYTIILKPLTPQNIVIGGLSGATPPVLGWSAVTGEVSSDALILLLIIFVWTPPHFWALALYRKHEYAMAGIPMLPVARGDRFTCLHILLYTILLTGTTLLPFVSGMSGLLYLACAVVLDSIFLRHAVALNCRYTPIIAARAFRYSISYLAGIFAALLIDHYIAVH